MSRRFTKFRKVIPRAVATRGTRLSCGKIALKAVASSRITASQIESARMVINRVCERKGSLVIRVAATLPVTKKPLEVRMGGGKGPVDHFVASVSAGTLIFELDNVPLDVARDALERASYKLPIPCKVVYRRFAYFA